MHKVPDKYIPKNTKIRDSIKYNWTNGTKYE